MKEINIIFTVIICITAIILACVNHSECLTGHDIDARIQQNYQQQGE